MKMTKRGNTWYVDFVNSEGRRQRLSTKQSDERLARARAAELMHNHFADQLSGDERKTLGTHISLGAVLTRTYEERWKRQRGAKERSYQLALLMTDVGHWPLHTVTTARVKEYAAYLMRDKKDGGCGLMPATVNRKLSMIKTALNEAAELGELQGSPKIPYFTEDNEKERYVTLAEEAHILKWFADNVAPADNINWYFRDLFVVLIDTGLRTSEGLGLTPERIVEDGTAIRLPKGRFAESRFDRTKSGKSRTVPLTQRAQEAVQRMLANPVHRKNNGNWGSMRWGRLMDRVGIPDVGLHTLRHTCASRLVQAGVSATIIQEWLGHANLKTTQRYMHLAPSNLRDAAAVLERPDAEPLVVPATTGEPTMTPEEVAQFRAWQASQQALKNAGVPPHPISFPQAQAHVSDAVTDSVDKAI